MFACFSQGDPCKQSLICLYNFARDRNPTELSIQIPRPETKTTEMNAKYKSMKANSSHAHVPPNIHRQVP